MKKIRLAFVIVVALLLVDCSSAPPPTPSQSTPTTPTQATSAVQASGASQTSAAPQAPTGPTEAPSKSDIWPKIYDDETYMTTFSSNWSEAEAVGAIKNLQNSFVEYSIGAPISELDVDPYGLRAKYQYVENNHLKAGNLIIPFDQVKSILLEHFPKLDKEYKWGLVIYLEGATNPVSLRTPTRDSAERLGKAIFALAKARNAKLLMPNPRFGASLAPLSDAQAKAAGIDKSSGVIVAYIFKESPAEKAGFSPQDIITSVAGKPIHNPDEVFAEINAAAASGAQQINIDGIRRSYKIENKKYLEVFVPITYTLIFDQGGGAQ